MSVISVVLIILALICFAIPAFTSWDAAGYGGRLLPAGLFLALLGLSLPALTAAL